MTILQRIRDVVAIVLFFLSYLIATQNGRKQMHVMSTDAIESWDTKMEVEAEARRMAEVEARDVSPTKIDQGIFPEPELKNPMFFGKRQK